MHLPSVLVLALISSSPCPAGAERPASAHGLPLTWTCDGAAATSVSLRLQRGRFFVVWQRPEIVLAADLVPGGTPDSVRILHRTQSPQVPSDNVLVLRTESGGVLTVMADTARTDQLVQTTSLYLTFVVSRAALAALLDAERGTLEVGGVRTTLKAGHFAGMRDWLVMVEGGGAGT